MFGRGVERSGLRGAAAGEACGFFFRETKGVQEVKSKEVLSGQTAGGFTRGQSMRATARAFGDLRQREVEINAWNVCAQTLSGGFGDCAPTWGHVVIMSLWSLRLTFI